MQSKHSFMFVSFKYENQEQLRQFVIEMLKRLIKNEYVLKSSRKHFRKQIHL